MIMRKKGVKIAITMILLMLVLVTNTVSVFAAYETNENVTEKIETKFWVISSCLFIAFIIGFILIIKGDKKDDVGKFLIFCGSFMVMLSIIGLLINLLFAVAYS